MRIVVGITGATGAIYGVTLLRALRQLEVETHLVLSEWAKKTIQLECTKSPGEVEALATTCYGEYDLSAAISSGSFQVDGMVVAPCSMKTLAMISHGLNTNLIGRAADVSLKERRKLVLVPRETPLHLIHLENMTKAARAGAIILPPMPAFYNHPATVQQIVNHTVARILDVFSLDPGLSPRWTGEP